MPGCGARFFLGGDYLDKNVQYIKGVGPVRARHLARLGIFTCRDLVEHYPREYVRRQRLSIKQLPRFPGEMVIVSGKIVGRPQEYRKRIHILNVTIADDTGSVRCTWFNQGYLRNQLLPGHELTVAGKFLLDYGGNITVDEYSLDGSLPDIQPLYNLTEGITNQAMSKILRQALKEHEESELFPAAFRTKYKLLSRLDAIRALHVPDSPQQLERALYTGKFTELFLYQLSFILWRRIKERRQGFVLRAIPNLLPLLERGFGFRFSPDQVEASKEIQACMAKAVPMSRLLQGDVGSGKTAVAIQALFTCALNGYKAVFMAPTEIVAVQHFNTLQQVGKTQEIKIYLLTGSTPKSQREVIHQGLIEAGGTILVGTHAVFQADVKIEDLALVITDEQHRFGVQQRLALTEKGRNPHVLAMSATPIPRTLAMTLYGDLDISTIGRKPPGRKEIKTKIVPAAKRHRVFQLLRQEIAKGNTGYIICSLIEDSSEVNALSLESYEGILADALPGYKYGVLHGRLTGMEKERIVEELKAGRLSFLLATTVVEVGVDVGRATFIVIENSERYGLAQLHQLRGRVGRRDLQSYCFLVVQGSDTERLKILESTNDGFAVALADLRIRGSGQFLGYQQHD